MKLIIAVSGGIDSVVLLDMISRTTNSDIVVAHVDHGMRPDSSKDAEFVHDLARKYGAIFELYEANLGPDASEEEARDVRYDFLESLAAKYDGVIFTAHHGDDVIETIALNIERGVRWRGLAVMSNPRIRRPLVDYFKSDLEDYAAWHHLSWREDSTNSSDKYARNRIRSRLKDKLSKEDKLKIIDLWKKQRQLKEVIEGEIDQFASLQIDRYWYTMVDLRVAEEVLYSTVLDKFGVSLLSDQLERGIMAIKTLAPGRICQIGSSIEFHATKDGGRLLFVKFR